MYKPIFILVLIVAISVAFLGIPTKRAADKIHPELLTDLYNICNNFYKTEVDKTHCVENAAPFGEAYLYHKFKFLPLIRDAFSKSGISKLNSPLGKLSFSSGGSYYGDELITDRKDLEGVLKIGDKQGVWQTLSETEVFSTVRGIVRTSTYTLDHILEIVPEDNISSGEAINIHHVEFGTKSIKAIEFCDAFNITILEKMNFSMNEIPCFGTFVLQISNKDRRPDGLPEVTLIYAEIFKNSFELAIESAINLTRSTALDLFAQRWLSECESKWKNSKEEREAFKGQSIFFANCAPTISYTSVLLPPHAYSATPKGFILKDVVQSSIDKSKKKVLPEIVECKNELIELISVSKEVYQKKFKKIKIFKTNMDLPIDDESVPKSLSITLLHGCDK